MGDGIGEIKKKGMIPVVPDKIQRMPVDEIGGVNGIPAPPIGKVDARIVCPDMDGVVGVGQRLAVVAKEIGEAFFAGCSGAAGVAKTPFAKDAGGLAIGSQDGGKGACQSRAARR